MDRKYLVLIESGYFKNYSGNSKLISSFKWQVKEKDLKIFFKNFIEGASCSISAK